MRRDEFAVMNDKELAELLHDISYGVLGTWGDDGWPELTPLNYVYHGGAIYFHGSRAGQKMRNLKADARVTFSVSKEYAIIPSYFQHDKLACPATAYFKSVIIKGYGEIVDNLEEKADALGAFMRKLQPEGGYAPITPADADYEGQLKATSVVRIRIEQMTGKYKFGQNLKSEAHDRVAAQLEERGLELDAETAELMRRYCPHHQGGN
ncbi:pyridoxamine 5'-phosphate oxidase family protein [Paenibacillus chartarius]|uniref:Pyridoxamine 5'-phosphate oxidase family protein n=1 Tax=Paenibacillus chartarius TaxID=747481 RepID=A0ABV6DGM9_9BACL